ncbi:Mis12 protein-domain-containing protein [Nemania sp. FL0916]|nr:Mis12 protein-domain-containing protein [Nemania sp. FL0916]
MTTSGSSETELLTEHFGYPPVSLIDDIINSINVLAERALTSVEQGLLGAPPAALGFKAPKSQSQQHQQQEEDQESPAERAKNEVEAGTHQLETLLCASIDRNFDKFEIYVLRNIFTVRPPELCRWIRLAHYDGLDFSATRRRGAETTTETGAGHEEAGQSHDSRDADAPTIESVTALRRRLRESMRLNALLTAERARNEALLRDLRQLAGDPAVNGPQVKAESTSPAQQRDTNIPATDDTTTPTATTAAGAGPSPFAFLHQKGDLASSGGGAAPLATTAAFTLSQMQALRALSTALSNVLPDLKALNPTTTANTAIDNEIPGGGGAGGSRAWRRERAEYVEAATRRHLETVHGLELGQLGEVRDGEWQGPGRNLVRGEVEGLERVVKLVSGEDEGEGAEEEGDGDGDGDGERMDES